MLLYHCNYHGNDHANCHCIRHGIYNGNYHDNYNDNYDESNKIRSSTGIAVDWFTPIGPLNFSLSQPITKVSTDKTETFQFNLGTTF